MNQLDKIIEITKETLKKSISYRPISSLEDDFEKYQKRGFIEAISKKVSKEETAIIAEIKYLIFLTNLTYFFWLLLF